MGDLFNFSWVTQASAWIGLVTLIALEIVLGIDNIVFITIQTGKLPVDEQAKARKQGLILAVIPRIILLLAIPFVLALEHPVITLPFADPAHEGQMLGISWQDIIVIVGGLFLLANATHEIHGKLEGEEHGSEGAEHATNHSEEGEGATGKPVRTHASYASVIGQIMALNIIFSLDSIITAIGIIPKEQVMVMILAVIASTAVMALAINPVSAFVEKHPSVKMLALSFLILIGMTLILEGFHGHIPKGYVYFAMGFSVFVELLNIKASKAKKANNKPVTLRKTHS